MNETAPTGHTGGPDEYCLSPGCASQECRLYAQGFRSGMEEALADVTAEVRDLYYRLERSHVGPEGRLVEYLSQIPMSADLVPGGVAKVVIHNHVRPAKRLGTRGFRAWVDEPSSRYVPCGCSWAPQLGGHYVVRKPDEEATVEGQPE